MKLLRSEALRDKESRIRQNKRVLRYTERLVKKIQHETGRRSVDHNYVVKRVQVKYGKKVFERNGYDPNVKWKSSGDYVLLCMQKVGDASMRGADVFDWTENTLHEIRKHTDMKIIVRPHPLYRKSTLHKQLQEKILKY